MQKIWYIIFNKKGINFSDHVTVEIESDNSTLIVNLDHITSFGHRILERIDKVKDGFSPDRVSLKGANWYQK